jgi:hypothetical protein
VTQRTVGGARLGLDRTSYRAIFGAPSITTPFPGGTTRLAYERGEIQVFMRGGVGTAVLAVAKEFTTAQGIGPCANATALVRAYGHQLVPYRSAAAHNRIVAYRLGRLLFGVPGGRVSALMLTADAHRDLPLLLAAAPCGKGDED